MSETIAEDLLDLVDSDHRGIGALAERLAAADTDFDRDVEGARLVREIVEHHGACEQYLHPLIRHTLPDGEQVAEQQFAEHRAVETLLRHLEHTTPASPAFTQTLQEIVAAWQANGAYLDQQVFPLLRRATDPTVLTRLATLALRAEYLGPTRPRTVAVQEHLANAVLSDVQGLVDKTIDSLTHHGHAGTDELHALLLAGHYDNLEDRVTRETGTCGRTARP